MKTSMFLNFAFITFCVEALAINWDRVKIIIANTATDEYILDSIVGFMMTLGLIVFFHAVLFALIGKFILDIQKIRNSEKIGGRNDRK